MEKCLVTIFYCSEKMEIKKCLINEPDWNIKPKMIYLKSWIVLKVIEYNVLSQH